MKIHQPEIRQKNCYAAMTIKKSGCGAHLAQLTTYIRSPANINGPLGSLKVFQHIFTDLAFQGL
jgi:hypothetical protein